MKYFNIIVTAFAASFVAAAPAPAPALFPADGDTIVPAILGYKRSSNNAEDLGYKRDSVPDVAVASKAKRFCAAPGKK
ncbi:hypothetical protein BJ170DRAFT_644261 [Xylariales sp. AK1849]|nr:hypothetical protein BJ170DRAFT_644261 [Xylariales sp. AK1849]